MHVEISQVGYFKLFQLGQIEQRSTKCSTTRHLPLCLAEALRSVFDMRLCAPHVRTPLLRFILPPRTAAQLRPAETHMLYHVRAQDILHVVTLFKFRVLNTAAKHLNHANVYCNC